jgi:hypothetical protein
MLNRLLAIALVCAFSALAEIALATERLSPLPQSQNKLVPIGNLSPLPGPLRSVLVAPKRRGDQWRAARVEPEIPQGDPLVDALNFSVAERMLFADASDGKLDESSLLEAALVACGVNQAGALQRYDGKFAELRRELRRQMDETNAVRSAGGNRNAEIEQKIRALHHVLHERALVQYNAEATDLAATLDTGVYNCASAALLFVGLANEAGLSARGLELPGHVRVVVDADGGCFELEVTCPRWQEAMRWQPSGASEIDSANEPGPRREVSELGLIAMIYYNRGIDAFEQHLFAAAVAANRRALLLDPSNTAARGNLLAAVNNWALALSDVKRFEEAKSLLEAGLRFDPQHAAFAHNLNHVRRRSIETQLPAS